jgi:lysophospholipase
MTEPANPRRRIPAGMTFASWAAADGWRLRRFDWPRPDPCGSMLFLGGRGDFIEKYLEALAHWHGGGWSLTGFDWRGQGGSGRLLADPLICHQRDFDLLLDDLAAFVRAWSAAAPPPRIIVAHSMGAHLLLRLLARGGNDVDAAVLASPMIDIKVKGAPGWLLGAAAWGACALGLAERRVWDRDVGDIGGRMTSCPDRRADKAWWKAQRPDIASGAPSWGWIRAARRSIARLAQADLGALRTPVLMLAIRRDPIVDVAAIRRAAATLSAAELVLFDGAGHELLREADLLRVRVLTRIDAFLERVAGVKRGPAGPSRIAV